MKLIINLLTNKLPKLRKKVRSINENTAEFTERLQTASGEQFDKSTDKIDAEAVIPQSDNGKKVINYLTK